MAVTRPGNLADENWYGFCYGDMTSVMGGAANNARAPTGPMLHALGWLPTVGDVSSDRVILHPLFDYGAPSEQRLVRVQIAGESYLLEFQTGYDDAAQALSDALPSAFRDTVIVRKLILDQVLNPESQNVRSMIAWPVAWLAHGEQVNIGGETFGVQMVDVDDHSVAEVTFQ